MRYGWVLPYGDAGTAAELAAVAEEHGWDGFFVWEGVWAIDAWVSLTAVAMRTTRAHYRARPTDSMLPPRPVQRPRVPIWVVGAWPRPKSMGRAARLDGWLPAYMPKGGGDRELTPGLLREGIAWLRDRRAAEGLAMDGYDVAAEGTTPPDAAAAAKIVRPWAEAGATWWIDADWSDMDPGRVRAAALERLRAGPPRL